MMTNSKDLNPAVEIMTKFKQDTELFLKQTIQSYLNAHIDSYIKRYYKKDRDIFTGWKNLLYGIMEEIKHQIEIDGEKNIYYPYKIKIINQHVNVKEHNINILIINAETNCVLKINILLKRYNVTVIAYIYVKVGSIVFELEE